jgi:hypothetical protein
MFNIFKKKSWLRFYSLDQNVASLYPIVPASEIDRDFNGVGTRFVRPESGKQTVKNCPGIKVLYNTGYVLRAPVDFLIKTGPDVQNFEWEVPFMFKKQMPNYTIPGAEYYVNWHSEWQTEPVIPREIENTDKPYLHTAVKVETPWRVKASDDILLMQLPVSYNNEARFTAAQGIVDPKYMHAIPVQLFWHVLEGETLVKAGTPLAQYVPISRSLLEKNGHEITVDVAGDVEHEVEDAFIYANHNRFPKFDNVANKAKQVMKVFDNLRKKYPKSKI